MAGDLASLRARMPGRVSSAQAVRRYSPSALWSRDVTKEVRGRMSVTRLGGGLTRSWATWTSLSRAFNGSSLTEAIAVLAVFGFRAGDSFDFGPGRRGHAEQNGNEENDSHDGVSPAGEDTHAAHSRNSGMMLSVALAMSS